MVVSRVLVSPSVMLSSASTFDQDLKLPVSSLGAWPHHLLWISERNTQCLQGRSLGSPGDSEPQCKIAGRMFLPSAVSQGKSFLRHRSGGCLSACQVVSAMFGIRVAEPASSQSEEGKAAEFRPQGEGLSTASSWDSRCEQRTCK